MSFSFELNLTFNSKKKMIWIKALSLIYYCVASRYSFIKDANEWVWRIKRVVEDLNRWCMGRRVWWTRDLSFIDFESRNSGDVHLNFRWWIWNLAWQYDEQVSFSVCVCAVYSVRSAETASAWTENSKSWEWFFFTGGALCLYGLLVRCRFQKCCHCHHISCNKVFKIIFFLI